MPTHYKRKKSMGAPKDYQNRIRLPETSSPMGETAQSDLAPALSPMDALERKKRTMRNRPGSPRREGGIL